jgi:hypothetical protein
LQTLMIYKWVNSIITLNSQVAKGTRKYGNGKEAHSNKNHSSLSSRAYGFKSCPDY